MVTPIDIPPDPFKGALETMKRQEDDLAEYLRIDARLRRVKYDALIEQGFSAEQALALSTGKLITA